MHNKTDIDSYFDKTKPHIKTLIENQLKKLEVAKIIMTLWVRCIMKRIRPLIELGSVDAKNIRDLDDGITGNNYIRVEMPFNSLITEFFEGSGINDLIELMLAYIKVQTENPKFPEGGFTLDKIMHLHINFHRLALTRDGSYTGLREWLKNKKAVINPQKRMKSALNGLPSHHRTRCAYHFCMNCLNGFRKVSARDKHYEYCSSNGHIKLYIPTEKKND